LKLKLIGKPHNSKANIKMIKAKYLKNNVTNINIKINDRDE